MAAELCDGHVRETDIILTPAQEGRFEIYLNGEKVYDRKAPPETDFMIGHRAIRKVRDQLREAITKSAGSEEP